MKPFQSQLRLQKWQVDEAQMKVAELLRLDEGLRTERVRLDAELAAEQRAAAMSLDASLTYGVYAREIVTRREKIDRSIGEVSDQLEQARDLLRDKFGELEKFELAAEAAAQRLRRQRDMREQQQQDELGLAIYRRRSG